MTPTPKRLIEVDLPIKKISAHARREKSIRHGHISTLHIWWARRPLAACRAVICAALWPDPADEQCPQAFREAAATILTDFAEQVRNDAQVAGLVKDHWSRWNRTNEATFGIKDERGMRNDELKKKDSSFSVHPSAFADLRYALLDFIADFANWDASTVPAFLNTARALTQAAHESLGGLPGTRPLVVDPFAGGGAIPLEALRVGADAFASDLNPVAVLLNKVVLEYIPKYGKMNAEVRMMKDEGKAEDSSFSVHHSSLAEAVRYWGQWIKEQAEQELGEFYPKDPDGATPIAYLWARTIISEAPDDGTGIPVEVPLMRSLWLAKKSSRGVALRWQRDATGRVQTETVEVTYANGVTRKVRRPLLEVFEPKKASEVEEGTVARGSATCPVTGFTTPVASVRRQLKERRGGAADARLFAVVTTRPGQQGRFYRLPTVQDLESTQKAATELERRKKNDERGRMNDEQKNSSFNIPYSSLSLVPDEEVSLNEIRRISVPIYGMTTWGDMFTPRQALALTTLSRLVQEVKATGGMGNDEFALTVQTCLGLVVDRQADATSSLCRWHTTREINTGTFGRQAIGMIWDFSEACVLSASTGGFAGALDWVGKVCETNAVLVGGNTHTERASATSHPLPDDMAQAIITDPPYYDAVPYAYLSDFFYVWLKRTLGDIHPDLFGAVAVPKEAEIVVDRPHELSNSTKDIAFYERELTKAFGESRRILRPDGIGTIVFASKTTASWEAILQAVVDSGWIITGSWPIDTEMEARVAAQGQARLASSIHLVCRPRESEDGSLHSAIGDWRDVLQELPQRIHAWLPRLAQEGVVGADAIFACLGPALEIYSRYSRVEKASGSVVSLKEYLEQVWAAVAKEALNTIFEGADTTGFEPDARLTAIWFWTLKAAANGYENDTTSSEDDEKDDEVGEGKPTTSNKKSGYLMEYDAVRKLAQGLGADLTKLSRPGGIITISGNIATLNGISHRQSYLIGQQQSLFDEIQPIRTGRSRGLGKTSSATMKSVEARQISLFDEEKSTLDNPDQPFLPTLRPEQQFRPLMDRLLDAGVTVLDRLHQAMLLFGRSQTALLGPFLQETHMGDNPRFWQLANALLALYPPGTEEKRWVEGVLARKKGLGF